MYTLQGFFNYTPLVDNTRDTVALFGEISNDGLTYAKDKAWLTHADAPQTTLISFHSVKDNSYLDAPSTIVTTTLRVGQYLLDRAFDGQIGEDPELVRSNLQAEFADDLQNVVLGELLEEDTLRMPEWVRFTVINDQEVENTITVWLADDSFRRQYTHYEIEVLPPFEPLDDFFLDPLQVKLRLDSSTLTDKMVEVQQRRGEYPYTMILAQRYDYQDPQDETWKLPTDWVVLIYGQAGNNPDLIKNEIVEYVLERSTHTREEWTEILPDLFTSTEFVITPFWTQYSVPNKQLQAGIYSPTVDPRNALALLQQTTQGPMFTAQWIADQYELSGVVYKSLAFGVVGNPENRDGLTQFSSQFEDYMLVTNSSPDFNRMSVRTQEFKILLDELIKEAENFTTTSSVPVGMARLIRNDVLYITAMYENVMYLVVAKSTVESLT